MTAVGLPRRELPRRVALQALVALFVALLVALVVCLDPIVATYGWRALPHYALSLAAGALGLGLAVLANRTLTWWPARGVGVLAVLFTAGQFGGLALGPLDTTEIATFGIAALWLAQSAVEVRRPIQFSPLYPFNLALMFLAVLALINRPGLNSYVSLGEKFLLFFLVVDNLRQRSGINALARIIVITASASALVAVAQFLLFLMFDYQLTIGTPTDNPETFLKPTPFGLMARPTAFFPNPAGLNDYLLFAAGLCLFGALERGRGLARSHWLALLVLMTVAIVLTWSTMATLALLVMFGLCYYVHRPSYAIHYTAALFLAGIVAYASGLVAFLYELLQSFGGPAAEVRLSLLKLAMESLRDHPLIGLGIQNFASVSQNYFPEGPYIYNYPVHNAFVQMATELGIFGGLLYASIVVLVFARLAAATRTCEAQHRWIVKGMLLGWCGIIFHMMTEPMAYQATTWLVIGAIEAVLVALRAAPEGARSQRSLTGATPHDVRVASGD